MSARAHQRVVDALEAHGSAGRGNSWQCPAHDDQRASLKVTDVADRCLTFCHAGCSTLDILAALGLDWGALFDEPAVGKSWTTATLRKVGAQANGDGRVTLGSVRYKPGAAAGETKSLALKGSKRDLWPAPETVEGTTLFVVEGEPDAVTAANIGLPAVGVPGAAKWRPEWGERIAAGRDRVVIITDCDEPGRKAAQTWAAAIAEHCRDVRIVDLAPHRDDGHDLSDWVTADAFNDEDLVAARALVEQTVELTKPVGNGSAPSSIHPTPLDGGWMDDPKLRVLDVERMLTTEPEPVPWIVEPLLATGCVTMLAGREGQGKSMLALALASAIGHGANVAGFDCHPGRVLYIDAENGEREAHRRVRGLGVKPGRLVYVEAVGFNLAADVELLIGLVDEHHPGVLVLDSLRSLAPGLDENDSRPVEAALRPVSRLAQDKGLPVLLLHHAGKQGSEYRGSTAIGAAVELGFTLSRRDEDPEKRTRRRLACWKSRPAPEPEPRWITLDAGDGVILLGEAEPFESEGGRKRDELRDDVIAVLTGITQSRARIARAVGRNPGDTTVLRVLQDLEKEGLAGQRHDGWVRPFGGDVA